MTTNAEPYCFKRVEEFFGQKQEYRGWDSLNAEALKEGTQLKVSAWSDKDYTVNVDVGNYSVSIVLLSFNMFRVHFHPAVRSGAYPEWNSRAVVGGNNAAELREYFNTRVSYVRSDAKGEETSTQSSYGFKVVYTKSGSKHTYTTYSLDFEIGFLIVEIDVSKQHFSLIVKQIVSKDLHIEVFNALDFYFRPNGFPDDFEVVHTINKPASAKYLGFGEQGGQNISKNQSQMTYFNYDNMRYKQVYNQGPCDPREPLYHSDPFFIQLNGTPHESMWGIYVDNPSQILVDVGFLDSKVVALGTRFGGLDYYFFLGKDVAMLTRGFTALIGRPKLKPRYALGYHQGCYGYDTREKVLQAARDHRNNDVPLDGLHIDVDMQYQYRTFSIAANNEFPDPKSMFDELRGLGVKCSTNITPVISNLGYPNHPGFSTGYTTYDTGCDGNHFVKEDRDWASVEDGYAYVDFPGRPGGIDRKEADSHKYYIGAVYYGNDANGTERGTDGHYPNLYDSKTREWWGQQYKYLLETGLEFVWQDMTTPAIRDKKGDYKSFPMRLKVSADWLRTDPKVEPVLRVWNLYSYNLHKATFHGLNRLNQTIPGRELKRSFIIGRGSFSGMHRYAGLWTGDNASTWHFFRINIAQAMALGICGMSINGQDIGGFETGEDDGKWCDPQLLIRWTIAGAFLPWFRNHYQAKNGVKYFQEPYRYPRTDEELRGFNIPQDQWHIYKAVLPACRHFITLRYRLMQVFYDAMFYNMFDGIPMIRALVLNEPHDHTLFNDNIDRLSDQLFVGGDLLVAPIMYPDQDTDPAHQRRIYLPNSCNWYQFMDNRRALEPAVLGGTTIRDYGAKISDDPNHIPFLAPMFVRAGAIIPMLEAERFVGDRNQRGEPNPLTFNIYPGARSQEIKNKGFVNFIKRFYDFALGEHLGESVDGVYNLYLDNGDTLHGAPATLKQFRTDPYVKLIPKEKQSQYRHTIVTNKFDVKSSKRTIQFIRVWDKYTPLEKYFFVAILHEPSEGNDPIVSVELGGKTISKVSDNNTEQAANKLQASTENAWYYNPNIRVSFIKVFDDSKHIIINALVKK